jgi:hypothetical protein
MAAASYSTQLDSRSKVIMAEETQKKQQIKVRYTETSALYASQFILNSSGEDITINFSSGPLVDPASGETILPIHSRIALSKAGARRLLGVLSKVLSEQADQRRIAEAAEAAQARLPKTKQ